VSALTIRPVDATLGAVVSGVDLRSLDETTWRDIAHALDEHAVLVFPEQHLTPAEQRRFAERFGPISTATDSPESAATSTRLPRSDRDHGSFDVANIGEDGSLLTDPEHPWVRTLAGNFEWHTDSSYLPVSALVSMLTAHVVPSSGGQTEWADMRSAYDDLAESMRQRIAPLSAYHSFVFAQHRLFGGDGTLVDFRHNAPLRPLVKTHSATGRQALYIGRHAFGVSGLTASESADLLDELHEFACTEPRTYRHEWRPGDLVVWDNRSVLHRGRPWDVTELRHLVHSRVAGDPRHESAAALG
jgi:alpha-ketoglutarate-dependent taurine dioxygenase